MSLLKKIKSRLKSSTASTYQKIALLAVIITPLIYCVSFLNAFWDPYSKIVDVPIALVNQDSGYTTENGENVNLGDELVTSLKDDESIQWHFVSYDEAETRMNNSEYYASLTVPTDFSAKVYSADSDNPESAQLVYRSREANNYVATTITTSVSEKVTNALSQKISSNYFNNIFVSLRIISSGLTTASSGADKLTNGLGTVRNGNAKITNGLSEASAGSTQIANNLNTLNSAQSQLTEGLKNAVTSTQKLQTGASTIASSLGAINTGLTSVTNGITGVNTGVQGNQTALNNTNTALKNYILANPSDPNISDLNAIVGALESISNNQTTGLGALSTNLTTLSGTTQAISGNLTTLQTNQTAVATNLTTLTEKLDEAQKGSQTITSGSAQLSSGADSLTTGIDTLKTGSEQVTGGLNEVITGEIQLRDELAKSAQEVANSTDENKTAKEADVMSAPVTMENNSYDKVANYGSGFAPYFISLSLWVGALLCFFVIDFTKKTTSKSAAVAKYVLLGVVGTIQAILLAFVLQNMMGLKVVNVIPYYGFCILMSWSFIAFMQLLIQHLGDIGRYVVILLLILQLSCSAGTFPKETLPEFFQILNPFMPMTFSVQALREIIFTTNLRSIVPAVSYFLGVLGGSMLISLLLTKRKTIKAKTDAKVKELRIKRNTFYARKKSK